MKLFSIRSVKVNILCELATIDSIMVSENPWHKTPDASKNVALVHEERDCLISFSASQREVSSQSVT